MTNIDDLKSDWKSLKKPESSVEKNKYASSLINDFKAIQRKTKKENIIASIFFILTTTFLWTIFYFMDDASWWVWSGLIIITAEMIGFVAFAWFRNSLKKWGDLQCNSYQYLSSAIKKLKYRKFLMLYVIPIYALMLITGINLIYIDVISDLDMTLRWVIHLIVSIALAGFFFYTIRKKLKKEHTEVDPLIEEFQTMKKGLD